MHPTDGFVNVTLLYRNVGHDPVTAEGESLIRTALQDQGGPTIDTDSLTHQAGHLAVEWYFSCQGKGIDNVPPPDRQLQHGQTYGPFTLCFEIDGPATQSIALNWSGDPLPPPDDRSFVVPLPN